MPYKIFQVNEVLTAADVNDYLMEQAVMTFADSTARATAIGTPTAGMMSFLTSSTAVEVYSGSTAVGWTAITGGGGGGVTVGTAAPSSPSEGDMWWDSGDGKLFVYYNDGSSSQWVDAAGPSVAVQSTAPTGYEGQLWLDDTDGSMYVYYTDPGGTASSWIGAVSRSGGILQVVSTTKTDTFSASVGATPAVSPVTGLSASITPRSTSSKVLVTVNAGVTSSNANFFKAVLYRDGSPSGFIGDSAGSRHRVSVGVDGGVSTSNAHNVSFSYLDSPSTTSSVTYDLRVGHTNNTSETVYVNRSVTDTDGNNFARSASSITLMEVAG